MRLTFVQPPTFVRNWKKLGLDDDDLRALETLIMERPEAGDVMQGTNLTSDQKATFKALVKQLEAELGD